MLSHENYQKTLLVFTSRFYKIFQEIFQLAITKYLRAPRGFSESLSGILQEIFQETPYGRNFKMVSVLEPQLNVLETFLRFWSLLGSDPVFEHFYFYLSSNLSKMFSRWCLTTFQSDWTSSNEIPLRQYPNGKSWFKLTYALKTFYFTDHLTERDQVSIFLTYITWQFTNVAKFFSLTWNVIILWI